MNNWKYTDVTNRVVSRENSNGTHESCLVSTITEWLSEGNTPDPADIPIPPRITSVAMRQARLALLQAGLYATVQTSIAVMPGVSGEAARIEWEFASDVQRDSALVAALGSTLGLDTAQLDALFVSAVAL